MNELYVFEYYKQAWYINIPLSDMYSSSSIDSSCLMIRVLVDWYVLIFNIYINSLSFVVRIMGISTYCTSIHMRPLVLESRFGYKPL